jgi:subtilisin family serine protease
MNPVHPELAEGKRRVRIGIIDSGVHAAHPHIGNIAGGVTIAADSHDASYIDRLGHGTAIAALIHQRAPQADLFAVKVFHDALVTNLATLIFAIDWCLDNHMDLINLSLGTTNRDHYSAFETAVARVHATGRAIISAAEIDGLPSLPGCLPGVIAVISDSAKEAGEHTFELRNGLQVVTACPWAREIPGVPRERNLHGISFAVAHVTAALAHLRASTSPSLADWSSLLRYAHASHRSATAAR